jgi:hypothetical protein
LRDPRSRPRAAEPSCTGAPQIRREAGLPVSPALAATGGRRRAKPWRRGGGGAPSGARDLGGPAPASFSGGCGWRRRKGRRGCCAQWLLRVVPLPTASSVEGGGGFRAAARGGFWRCWPSWPRRAARRAVLEVLLLPSIFSQAGMLGGSLEDQARSIWSGLPLYAGIWEGCCAVLLPAWCWAELSSPLWFASTWCGASGSDRRVLQFWRSGGGRRSAILAALYVVHC